jgi:hypothetical protein
MLQDWGETPASAQIELSIIAQRLDALSTAVDLTPFEPTDGDLAQLAKAIWKTRRARSPVFDPEIFGEPAWDMLLDLFQEQVAERQVYIKNACIGADVPTSTGLRWIDTLIERKWIVRQADPNDRRRQTVALSDEGMAKMRLCMRQMWDQLAIPNRQT